MDNEKIIIEGGLHRVDNDNDMILLNLVKSIFPQSCTRRQERTER